MRRPRHCPKHLSMLIKHLTPRCLLACSGQLPRDADRGAAHQAAALPGGALSVGLAFLFRVAVLAIVCGWGGQGKAGVQVSERCHAASAAPVLLLWAGPGRAAIHTSLPRLRVSLSVSACPCTPHLTPHKAAGYRSGPASHDLLHGRHPLRRLRHLPASEGVSGGRAGLGASCPAG